MKPASSSEARVAVLVDCDNTTPEILEHALRVVAQFGRVVLRRGYGNHSTLANKWQEALVSFPCNDLGECFAAASDESRRVAASGRDLVFFRCEPSGYGRLFT